MEDARRQPALVAVPQRGARAQVAEADDRHGRRMPEDAT